MNICSGSRRSCLAEIYVHDKRETEIFYNHEVLKTRNWLDTLRVSAYCEDAVLAAPYKKKLRWIDRNIRAVLLFGTVNERWS